MVHHDALSRLSEPGRAGVRHRHQAHRNLTFGVVSVALFMAAVDQTIVATALPAIQHGLHTRINWSGWTLTTYALGQVVAMPVAGKLSDQFGRKTIFLSAVCLFTVSSLCCGIAGSVYLLIPLRGLQALGGGAFMPSASGIVADKFGPDRDRAVAMFTSILPIGGIVGPVLGGIFVTYWSWRGIFLVNVPAGVILIVLGALIVPRSPRRDHAPVDMAGVLLLAVMLLAAMLGFGYLGEGSASPSSWLFVVPEAAAVAAGIGFVRHIRKHSAPFVPVRLLYGRGFGVMNVINFIYGGAVLGIASIVPLYAEQRYGFRPLAAGTLLTARAVGMIAVAGLASMALRRTGTRRPMMAGFILLSAGMVLLAVSPPVPPYEWLAAATAVTGLGMGTAVPATNNATLQLVPEQVAAIAGLRGMFRQSGAIMTLSVTTALLARSADPPLLQARVFIGFAVLLAALIPLTLAVPDHRGSW
jgi:EmrB/QacA subfamily drug resistance transporter